MFTKLCPFNYARIYSRRLGFGRSGKRVAVSLECVSRTNATRRMVPTTQGKCGLDVWGD